MSRRSPAAQIDHVLVAVADLAAGASWLEAEHGLRALPGGRHPGAGTANMIVPLGSAYLELIAVVDPAEAASAPTAQLVMRAVAARRRFAAWAVRTDALDVLRDHLKDAGWDLPEPARGSRVRPDGVTLRWRTQLLAPPGEPGVLPFVIEWAVPPHLHPAAAEVDHPSGAQSIRAVRLGDPDPDAASARLRTLLGGGAGFSVERSGAAGVVAVEIDAPGGGSVIR